MTPQTFTRNFVGATVSSVNVLRDEMDQTGIFFVLLDLNVRAEGMYRIELTLTNLSREYGQLSEDRSISETLAEACADHFVVWAKTVPWRSRADIPVQDACGARFEDPNSSRSAEEKEKLLMRSCWRWQRRSGRREQKGGNWRQDSRAAAFREVSTWT